MVIIVTILCVFLVQMGLVCFRLKGNNELNKKLLSNINASGKLHMVPAAVHGRFVVRFCVCAQDAQDSDIDSAWDVITDFAAELLEAEMVMEKSGVPLPIMESSNQEVGQVTHKVEISELMELMERAHIPARPALRKTVSSAEVAPKPKVKLGKQLSKRQFSFTETIEFVSLINDSKEES